MTKNKLPSVSIVTITQLKRFECIKNLFELIKLQTYKNIQEWVLCEGSKTQEDADKNKENIQNFIKEINVDNKINIVYIEYVPGTKLGALRNRGNTACTGDITVCMDDDDYYPPERVSTCVNSLLGSKALIAGNSDVIMYDYFIKKLFKFKQFTPFHSTNNCMAWKKEYLKTNKHDDSKEMGEEASFTNNFTNPLIQMESKKTIVVSSHDGNTFNKRELCFSALFGVNPTMEVIKEPITEYIPEKFLKRMESIFVKEQDSPYDIVYYTGGFGIPWDPQDGGLGGSEQAIMNLCEEWVKKGKKVAVYAMVPNTEKNGVKYFEWNTFPYHHKFKTVILWRLCGLAAGGFVDIKADNLFLDLHDNVQEKGQMIDYWNMFKDKVDKVFFKSNYHKEEFKNMVDKDIESKAVVIVNGIRINKFVHNWDNVTKNPFRFCYCSCYTRGLANILQHIWPIIYKYEPRAELHIYYGMNNVKDENFRKAMTILLSQPGVMDHGRQPVEIICREKYLSNFHFYVTNTRGEIDCISIKESLITGAIPLISNYGVFKERDGIHFDLDDNNPKQMNGIAIKILQLLREPEKLNQIRTQLRFSPTIKDWNEIAPEWLVHMVPKEKEEVIEV